MVNVILNTCWIRFDSLNFVPLKHIAARRLLDQCSKERDCGLCTTEGAWSGRGGWRLQIPFSRQWWRFLLVWNSGFYLILNCWIVNYNHLLPSKSIACNSGPFDSILCFLHQECDTVHCNFLIVVMNLKPILQVQMNLLVFKQSCSC